MKNVQKVAAVASIAAMTLGLAACQDAPESRQKASGNEAAAMQENEAPEVAEAPSEVETFDQSAIPAANPELTEVIDNTGG